VHQLNLPRAKRHEAGSGPPLKLVVVDIRQHTELARSLQLMEFPNGTVVCKQGQENEHFYIILGGTAEVRTSIQCSRVMCGPPALAHRVARQRELCTFSLYVRESELVDIHTA
jgi:hypothetical protein